MATLEAPLKIHRSAFPKIFQLIGPLLRGQVLDLDKEKLKKGDGIILISRQKLTEPFSCCIGTVASAHSHDFNPDVSTVAQEVRVNLTRGWEIQLQQTRGGGAHIVSMGRRFLPVPVLRSTETQAWDHQLVRISADDINAIKLVVN